MGKGAKPGSPGIYAIFMIYSNEDRFYPFCSAERSEYRLGKTPFPFSIVCQGLAAAGFFAAVNQRIQG
jgi:hypothetical protein